jgi:hypothetical protein
MEMKRDRMIKALLKSSDKAGAPIPLDTENHYKAR